MPAKVETKTDDGATVAITCDTNYPFSNTLDYTISASKPFDFYLRVPDWYDSSTSTLAVDGKPATIDPDSHTGMTMIHIIPGTTNTHVSYVVNCLSVRAIPRANSSVAIYHGAVLYALDMGHTTVATSTSSPPIPSQAHDYNMTNTRAWNMAIDTSTLEFHSGADESSQEKDLPSPLWTPEGPPTYITARGCQIDWPLFKGVPAPVPLPVDGGRHCTGPPVDITLRPYGSLKIHMAELPTVDLK